MRVVYVIDRKSGIDYGFMYELRDAKDVHDYMEEVEQPRWSYGFRDYLATADMSHPTTHEGSAIRVISEVKGEAPVMVMGRLMDGKYLGMLRSLPIAVNRFGGYFGLTDQEITESREVETWTLPGATLKISQWPNGKHYYAKIGDEEVEFAGRRKWDTRESALRAAKKFAFDRGLKFEAVTE